MSDMSDSKYYVKAPLVIAKNENGTDRYLYQGTPVPDHIKGDQLQSLVDSGMVTTDQVEAAQADPADANRAALDKANADQAAAAKKSASSK